MKILFKKCRNNAVMPLRATPASAGYDIYSANEAAVVIPAGEIRLIPTGLAVSAERTDIGLFIFPRSGFSAKYGVTLTNSVGVIDSDYRGEIMLSLINHGKEDFTVEPNMRIAQLVVLPVFTQEWIETDSLDDTDRGTGGFGSSGNN